MATLKSIETSKRKIYNPYGLVVTPFKNENELGDDAYFLGEVVRDTTSIAQDDPEETPVDNEFGSAPIINSIKVGSFKFSAEVADMQDALLEKLCGFKKGTAGKIYAPSTYVPKYAKIDLVFLKGQNAGGENEYVAAVLPKLQMNSKATFDSLSSSLGRITLAGTGLNMAIAGEEGIKESPFYLEDGYTLPEEEA